MFHPLWHCRICTPGLPYLVKATTDSRPTRYVITRRFSGTQLAQNFPQSSFSWKTLYTLPSEVSSFSSYVSLMLLSSLIMALHDTHRHSLWTGQGNPYRCLSSTSVLPLSEATHHIQTHFRETALTTPPPPTGDELPLVWHTWRAKTESHCVLPTFSHACNRPAILILTAGRSDTLTMRTCDCVTTQTCYTCSLHGDIRNRMMLLHMKYAVN